MVGTSASLWPDEIRAAVKSPLSILLEQAEALTNQTGGVLVGKVSRGTSDDDKTMLRFNIVVPELDSYRHRIMLVVHGKDMNYPAMVDAEVLRPTGLSALRLPTASPFRMIGEEPKKPANRADSDKELTDLVSIVIRSPYVVSVAQSLISRVADLRAGKETNVEPIPPPEGSPPAPRPELPAEGGSSDGS